MTQTKRKNPAAVALGRRGGRARIARMTPKQLRDHARHMVQIREAKRKAKRREGATS